MAKIKNIYQDDDSLYALRKTDEKNWEEFGELAQEVYGEFYEHMDGKSGKEATSWQDSGRACIRCGGFLSVIEEGENGNMLLKCNSCNKQQWEADIMPLTQAELDEYKKAGVEPPATADKLYRTIPDSLVMQYMNMREQYMQGK